MRQFIYKLILSHVLLTAMSMSSVGQKISGRIEIDTLKSEIDFWFCYSPFRDVCIDEVIIRRLIVFHDKGELVQSIDSLFYSQGEIILKVDRNFIRGGVIKTFYSDSTAIRLELLHSENELSAFAFFNKRDSTSFDMSFSDGVMDARTDCYYENDSTEICVVKGYSTSPRYLSNRRELRNGLRHGSYLSYHANGQIENQGVLVNGFGEGQFYYYNEFGILTQIVNCKKGEWHGWATYFNNDGSILKQEYFQDGTCVKGCD